MPHCRLIKKLDAYGIKGKLLLWIKDFLRNRSQQVVLNGSTSKSLTVSSGVPGLCNGSCVISAVR